MKKLFTVLSFALGLGLANAQQMGTTKAADMPPPPPTQGRMQTAKQTAPKDKMVAKPATKPTASTVKMKKDGTPDKRYNSSKGLKKDGTPDKRYKK